MINFKNSSPIDFTIPENLTNFANVLTAVNQLIDSEISVKPIVQGEKHISSNVYSRLDCNNGKQVIAQVHFANKELTTTAIKKLKEFLPTWQKTSLSERANILRRTAKLMQENQMELSALIVRETGKNWYEADRDVVEAIDFCNYYAELALESLAPFITQVLPGENNTYFYEPVGLAVVISPWNFPLAIPCGMLVAALVAGNVAILKPAEQSSLIAQKLVEILFQAGLPTEALAFLPGDGEEIGPLLLESSDVNLICFTGSLAVGQKILSACSKINPEQTFIKRCILELGGKNAIIVDEDADLDEAIKGILYSAFAYSGQKCSACSRVITIGSAHQALMDRLIPAAKDLLIGLSFQSKSFVGPVIDHEAQTRLLKLIEANTKLHSLKYKSNVPSEGTFVPVTIFECQDTNSDLWQQEIFGPVLAIKQAKSLAEAISLANGTKFGLTAGLYSRSPSNIAKVSADIRVGNFYINRACTGAIVGRQPFGGFKLSGIGSKAGGPDYLKQFVVPKVITENTMRRGFSPD